MVSDVSVKTICRFHEYKFGDSLQKQFTKCCDVLEKHKKKVKGGHVMNLDMAMDLKIKNYDVVPGWQLCRSCYKEIMKENKSKAEDDNSAE